MFWWLSCVFVGSNQFVVVSGWQMARRKVLCAVAVADFLRYFGRAIIVGADIIT